MLLIMKLKIVIKLFIKKVCDKLKKYRFVLYCKPSGNKNVSTW